MTLSMYLYSILSAGAYTNVMINHRTEVKTFINHEKCDVTYY